jgi:Ankyrin repeat
MEGTADLTTLLVAIAQLDHDSAVTLLTSTPSLATAALSRSDEFFLELRFAQTYEGDTALHAAAFSHDAEIARELIARSADLRARNRRGAEPLSTAGRCRASPPKRQGFDRPRPRPPNHRARRHGLCRGKGRTTHHHGTARSERRMRDGLTLICSHPTGTGSNPSQNLKF